MLACGVRVASVVVSGVAASLGRTIAPRRWSARISGSRVWLKVCRAPVVAAADSREVDCPSPLSGNGDADREELIGTSAPVASFAGVGGMGQRQATLSGCGHVEESCSRAPASGAGAEPSGTSSTLANSTVASGSFATSRTAVSARIETNSPSESPSCGACRAGSAQTGWTCCM